MLFKNPFATPKTNYTQPNKTSIILGEEDDGKPVFIDLKTAGHTWISGMKGSGISQVCSNLILNHVKNGGGLLMIDSLNNEHQFSYHKKVIEQIGRGDDVIYINPFSNDATNLYNPLDDRNPQIISTRLINMAFVQPCNGSNAEVFSEILKTTIPLVSALNLILPYFKLDAFCSIITDATGKQITELKQTLETNHSGSTELQALNELIQAYEVNNGIAYKLLVSDLKPLADGLMNIRSPLRTAFNSKSSVYIADCVKQNKIVIVSLDAIRNNHAPLLGRLIVHDLRYAVINAEKELTSSNVPFVFLSHDCLHLMDCNWTRLYSFSNEIQFKIIHVNQSPIECFNEEKSDIYLEKEFIFEQSKHRIIMECVSDRDAEIISRWSSSIFKMDQIRQMGYTKEPIVTKQEVSELMIGQAIYVKDNNEKLFINIPQKLPIYILDPSA